MRRERNKEKGTKRKEQKREEKKIKKLKKEKKKKRKKKKKKRKKKERKKKEKKKKERKKEKEKRKKENLLSRRSMRSTTRNEIQKRFYTLFTHILWYNSNVFYEFVVFYLHFFVFFCLVYF